MYKDRTLESSQVDRHSLPFISVIINSIEILIEHRCYSHINIFQTINGYLSFTGTLIRFFCIKVFLICFIKSCDCLKDIWIFRCEFSHTIDKPKHIIYSLWHFICLPCVLCFPDSVCICRRIILFCFSHFIINSRQLWCDLFFCTLILLVLF